MKVYKIRHKDTGLFWNGYTISHYPPFKADDQWATDGGRVYRSINAVRAAITNSYLNAATCTITVAERNPIEIVVFKMVEDEILER